MKFMIAIALTFEFTRHSEMLDWNFDRFDPASYKISQVTILDIKEQIHWFGDYIKVKCQRSLIGLLETIY